MLIIKALEKENDFSFCLRKNPYGEKNKEGFKKSVGMGTYHAYFPNSTNSNGEREIDINTFIIQYIPKEKGGKTKDMGEIEQFPISHITDPSILSGSVMNFLASGWKTRIEEEGEEHKDSSIQLEFFLFTEKNLDAFGVKRESLHMAHHIIQKFPSLFQGLNWFLALCSYLTDYQSKEDIKKAAKNCNNAELGYYPRYLLSKDTNQYSLFNTENITLTGGNTALQRKREIQDQLRSSQSKRLIDLGAGSLYVIKKVTKNYKEVIAIDYDFSYKTEKIGEVLNINLIKSNIQEWNGSYKEADVILSEVLEHNTKEEASKILDKVLNENPNKIIITVPNREFNKNFSESKRFRHIDHKWEPSMEELIKFLPKREEYNLQVKGIGDRVEDQYITLMAIYSIKETK